MNRNSPNKTVSVATPPSVAEGVRLLQLGEHRKAIACFEACLKLRPVPADALHYRGLALYQLGEREAGLAGVRESIALAPARLPYRQNLGGILLGEKAWAEAEVEFSAIVEACPEDFVALGSLCQARYRQGLHAQAIAAGQRCLEAKNAAFLKPRGNVQKALVPPFDPLARARNVIAYSVWGQDAIYLDGILSNARAAPHLYPEWTVRVYCDDSVPSSLTADLTRLGVQVVRIAGSGHGNRGLFWRFQVADDPAVDRYLIRDADSPLTLRERGAVEAWIDSGRAFHLMRDNILHCELVLAGLWGGVRGALPALAPMVDAFYARFRGRWGDQIFLREKLWSVIGPQSLTHDRHYSLGDSRPFPEFGRLLPGQHVGGSFPRSTDNRMHF